MFGIKFIGPKTTNAPKCPTCKETMKRAVETEDSQWVCPKGCTTVVVRASVKDNKTTGWPTR